MKGELFSHEVQRTSAVFGRKEDVTVVFQGDGAATDGSTIYLPSIDYNADVTDEQADVMRGYVDHEAGHVRHTNFAVAKKFLAECQRDGNVLLRSLANALEDIWLEKRVRDEYPGSEKNLRATATAVNKQFLADIKPSDPRLADDRFITPVALTWEGRKDYGGETCTQCLDLLPADLRRQLGVWIDAVNACRNTSDVIALARTIERELAEGDYRDDDRPVHGTPTRGTGSPDGDGSTGDGGDGDADGDGRGREGPSGQQPDGEGTSGDGSQSGDADGETDADSEAPRGHGDAPDGDVSEKSGDDVYTAFDLKDAVERKFREGGHLTSGPDSYRPLSTAHDKWHHRTDSKNKYPNSPFGHALMTTGTAAEYDNELRNMAGNVNVMRRKLERALMAKQQRDWDYAQENGRLDSRRFTAAFAGRTNVFKMRSDSNEIDTALTILVDLSGSMCGLAAYIAQQCAIAMCESIDRTGIRYEVLGFNNRSDFESNIASPSRKERRFGGYSRTEPLDMYVFKAFEERLFEAKGAMVTMVHCAGGNNSDGEAIVYAYRRLQARPESRKVMIVMSDGMPSSGGIAHHLTQHTRDAVQMATDNGVDCIGIGICSNAVSRFYPKYTVISDVSELASTGMDNLARALMGERFQVDNSKLLDAKKTA